METFPAQNHHQLSHLQFMTPLSTKLRPPLLLRASASTLNHFSSTSLILTTTTATPPPSPTQDHSIVVNPEPPPQPVTRKKRKEKVSKVISQDQLRENWLDSLSSPFLQKSNDPNVDSGPGWVIGIDPDVSGALAVLKPDQTAEVFDSPHVKVLVGKRIRKRPDPKSIVQLLNSFDAPRGTTAYIEQSLPYPQDGKQGWWSGGFGYGLWIGSLVASGFSVVPVPSFVWKNEFKLSGNRSNKDSSRELACTMFPSISSLFKRKKDHGRAEALLIAAYGKGLRTNSDCSCLSENGRLMSEGLL